MSNDKFKKEREALGYRIRELRDNFSKEKISQEELSFRTGHAKKAIVILAQKYRDNKNTKSF